MIAGLEFLRSRCFWLVLTAWTSAITLASAGAHVLVALYFPQVDGKPDELYHGLLALAFFTPIAGLASFFDRRNARDSQYPEGREPTLFVGVLVAATVVVLVEDFAVTRFLLEPVLGADAHLFFSFLLAFIFGVTFGEEVAKKVQADVT